MQSESLSSPAASEAAAIIADVWPGILVRLQQPGHVLPREVVWLGGAPGCGKGTQTAFINQIMGFHGPALVTSDLLTSPEMQRIKDSGGLVGDREVVNLLLNRLIEPRYADGLIVDGFPRTQVQVELVRLFHARMGELNRRYAGSQRHGDFPPPHFHAIVIEIDEEHSVERQLKRGREIIAHNEQVRATGAGALRELRSSDTDAGVCHKRYRVFVEQTEPILEHLGEFMPYYAVDGRGTISEVQDAIRNALN